MQDPVVIASIARTPIGKLLGSLKTFSANQLGAEVIRAAIQRASLNLTEVSEVMMGCVLPAGQGQAPARQASMKAGLSAATPCTTINKVCGSGMKAIMIAHREILIDAHHIMVVGGMESMTQAPYLLPQARSGYRLGHGSCVDHLMLDGLEDAYDKGRAMGSFAENCVKQYGFSRQAQDDFSAQSFERVRRATHEHLFSDELIALTYTTKQGIQCVDRDEHPFSVDPTNLPKLAPIFDPTGTITAGNSSAIADGAAALVLMRLSMAEKKGIQPLARIIDQQMFAKAPNEFMTAPIDATKALLAKIHWTVDAVDLFEINEAFAVVPMAFMHDLKIPSQKVNIHGGACALGHPIGATGARIVVTLLSALRQYRLKRGIATLCIGGGEATALALECFY